MLKYQFKINDHKHHKDTTSFDSVLYDPNIHKVKKIDGNALTISSLPNGLHECPLNMPSTY